MSNWGSFIPQVDQSYWQTAIAAKSTSAAKVTAVLLTLEAMCEPGPWADAGVVSVCQGYFLASFLYMTIVLVLPTEAWDRSRWRLTCLSVLMKPLLGSSCQHPAWVILGKSGD